MDWTSILVALITAGGAFLGTYHANKKQTNLMAYRLQELEKKVEKHNNVVERLIRLEQQVSTLMKGD